MANYPVHVEITVGADVIVEAESKEEAAGLVSDDIIGSAVETDIGCSLKIDTDHYETTIEAMGPEEEE